MRRVKHESAWNGVSLTVHRHGFDGERLLRVLVMLEGETILMPGTGLLGSSFAHRHD